MKKIVVYLNREFPFYSITLQTELLVQRIEEIFGVKVEYINNSSLSQHINTDNEIILWPIDSFKFELVRLSSLNNVVFIYHNITPAKYFWKSEPLVALRSIMGRLQLIALKFTNAKWVAVSKYNAEELSTLGVKLVEYCPNLLSGSISHMEKTEVSSLLFNGRIVQNKGCLELLNVVKDVAGKLRRPLQLYLVGSGKENSIYYKKFSKSLENLEKDSSLEIHWFQRVTPQQLADLYSKCWLYITMSKHEGFGLPACESIANGTPAVYIKCGGQESVLNSIGLCAASSISDTIVSLLSNEAELKELYRLQYQVVENYIIPNADVVIKNVYSKFLGK